MSAPPSTQPQGPAPRQQVIGAVAGLSGFLLSRLAGPAAWVPMIAALVLAIAIAQIRKRAGGKLTARDGATIAMGAHAAWMVTAALVTAQLGAVAFDLAVFAVLIAAVALWPRPIVFAAVIAFALLSAVFTVEMWREPAMLGAALVHTALRVAATVSAALAWRQIARERAEARPEPSRAGGPSAPVA